ncbi:hypothetical protein L596_016069 [Steinernema carpocapsae]|uniref:Uncharacterized protein n=1 Tax=Steinernema carpocapsae TaxID=34508 RepID=A0A4U5NGX1_STECR|nr:hypothetical protein L596_016069 [Steinernema carpocapsae]
MKNLATKQRRRNVLLRQVNQKSPVDILFYRNEKTTQQKYKIVDISCKEQDLSTEKADRIFRIGSGSNFRLSDPDFRIGSNRTFNKCQIPCWLRQCACAACFEGSCFGVRQLFVAICRDFTWEMAPRSTSYGFFEQIDGFFKCKKCVSQLKKPADRSTGALCKHAKTHGDIETKREVKRSDEGLLRKQVKLDFAEDSKSRNEKILRFFAAFCFGSNRIFRIGSNFRFWTHSFNRCVFGQQIKLDF